MLVTSFAADKIVVEKYLTNVEKGDIMLIMTVNMCK